MKIKSCFSKLSQHFSISFAFSTDFFDEKLKKSKWWLRVFLFWLSFGKIRGNQGQTAEPHPKPDKYPQKPILSTGGA